MTTDFPPPAVEAVALRRYPRSTIAVTTRTLPYVTFDADGGVTCTAAAAFDDDAVETGRVIVALVAS